MISDVEVGGVDPGRRTLAEPCRPQDTQQHRRSRQSALDEWTDPRQIDRTVWSHQRCSLDNTDERDVHRRRCRFRPKGAQVWHRHPHDGGGLRRLALSSRQSPIFEDGFHPLKVLVQRTTHPPAQGRSEQAQDPVRAQFGTHDQPASTGHVVDLACAFSVKRPRPADCRPGTGTVDLGVVDQPIPHSATEPDAERGTHSDRLWSEHLGMQHLRIPSRLISYVHDEVEHLLGRCRDVEHVLDHVRPKRNRAAVTPQESVAM